MVLHSGKLSSPKNVILQRQSFHLCKKSNNSYEIVPVDAEDGVETPLMKMLNELEVAVVVDDTGRRAVEKADNYNDSIRTDPSAAPQIADFPDYFVSKAKGAICFCLSVVRLSQ